MCVSSTQEAIILTIHLCLVCGDLFCNSMFVIGTYSRYDVCVLPTNTYRVYFYYMVYYSIYTSIYIIVYIVYSGCIVYICISWQTTYIITWVRTYDEHAVTEQNSPHKTQMIGYCYSILSWRHTCSEVLMLYILSDTIAESLVLSSHLVLGYNLILIISIQCFQTLRTSIALYEPTQ